MPTYEYHCAACAHQFDEFQSILEPPLKRCPKCRQPKLQRVFGTGAAVLFKGSGFYQTDYRSESYKAAAKADQEAAKPATAGKGGTDGPASTSAADNGSKSAKKTSKATT